MNTDDALVQELTKNEHIVQIVALEDIQREWSVAKKQVKSAVGYISPVNDTALATRLLRDLGYQPGKVVIKRYAGQSYVIFKGYPGARKIFKGTRYLTSNPKVVRMAIGPKGIIKSVKGGFVLTVVLSVGMDIFDYFIRDNATLSQLLGDITSDVIKIGVSAIAAVAAGLAVGSAAVIGSIAAAPLIAAIAVGVVTGIILDKLDKKFGATAALIRGYRHIGLKLDEIKYEVGRAYYELQTDPSATMRLFGMPGGYFGGY